MSPFLKPQTLQETVLWEHPALLYRLENQCCIYERAKHKGKGVILSSLYPMHEREWRSWKIVEKPTKGVSGMDRKEKDPNGIETQANLSWILGCFHPDWMKFLFFKLRYTTKVRNKEKFAPSMIQAYANFKLGMIHPVLVGTWVVLLVPSTRFSSRQTIWNLGNGWFDELQKFYIYTETKSDKAAVASAFPTSSGTTCEKPD